MLSVFTQHGVYHLSDDGKAVNALLYRAPDADIQAARLADGSCPLVRLGGTCGPLSRFTLDVLPGLTLQIRRPP